MSMMSRVRGAYAVVSAARNPRRLLTDDYLQWLTFANAGMQDPGNPYLMDLAIRRLPSSRPVVEIGSFCGLSTNILSYLLGKHQRPNALIGTDPWTFEHEQGQDSIGAGITLDEYADFVRESFRRNVKFFSRGTTPHVVQMTSDDFFGAWGRAETAQDIEGVEVALGGPISFAFIDGNHTYDFVRRDFEGVDSHLEIGGFVLFDDSADSAGFEVNRLMKEVEAHPRYDLVAKNPNYLFRRVADR
jgi:Methyltransferase domain